MLQMCLLYGLAYRADALDGEAHGRVEERQVAPGTEEWPRAEWRQIQQRVIEHDATAEHEEH